MQFQLANGAKVDVSPEEMGEFITQVLMANPYWRYSGLLNEDEVTRFLLKATNDKAELVKIARYILIHFENLSLACYLFDKSEGHPEQGKEFNMPVIQKLRDIYQKVRDNTHDVTDMWESVWEMENLCIGQGGSPI